MGCFHLNPSHPILAEQAKAGWQHWGGDESKRRNGENCPGEGERKGASGRGKRFIVFKPEIERTRWKQRRRKEGRDRERPYKKGEMVFEKRRPAESRRESSQERNRGEGERREVVRRAGVQEELERSEE